MGNQKTINHPDFSFLEIPGQNLNILSNEFTGNTIELTIHTFAERDSQGTLFLIEIDILSTGSSHPDNCIEVTNHEVVSDEEDDSPDIGLALVIVTDKTDTGNIRVNKRRTAGRIRGVVKTDGSK